jgi:hypothetical protein
MKTEQTQVMHSPTLNTVLMVELTLKNAESVIKMAELKRRLPKQIMHNTLVQILDYLQQSGKIVITTKGILWIYVPKEELEEIKKKGVSYERLKTG